MKRTSIILVIILFIFNVKILCQNAEDITGYWLVLDKKTNEPKSQIEIFRNDDGKYYGRIVWLKKPLKNSQPLKDENNPKEELRKRTILGLQILSGLEFSDDEWEDGKIYDPESGSTYKCKAWFEDNDKNKLYLRGYIGFSLIGRNVQWIREGKKRL
jgi:uncharacterized protein (DUF2147 family)